MFCIVAAMDVVVGSAQASVHVRRPDVNGPRPLQEQTATAAVHNYLEAWASFRSAFQYNNAELLDRDFVGTAEDKLSATIHQQNDLKIGTSYQDRSHDIQIVFYSPEGLSLELTDDVSYDVQVIDHDKPGGQQHMRAHYIVVMTPSETRWKVRVFQAVPE
jgi:hypothetical protein